LGRERHQSPLFASDSLVIPIEATGRFAGRLALLRRSWMKRPAR
jgi:hypothetical protein